VAFWMGKAMGSMFGLMTGGPFGMMFGAFFGHLFDSNLERWLSGQAVLLRQTGRGEMQRLFVASLYRVMGRVAKSDGRVNEAEIAAASFVMDRMLLKGRHRDQAMNYFNEGKDLEKDIWTDLRGLGAILNPAMTQMFLEVVLTIAYSDGPLSQEEETCIHKVCETLGVPASMFDKVHARIQEAIRQARGGDDESDQALAKAYSTLGVAADVSDQALKQEYRRLMNQNHPDKLSAQGLPDEMIQLAKEKTQEIQTAYALVKKVRSR